MRTSLRVKTCIAVAALFVLVSIPLIESKFFAPTTIKRWSKISWDDFQGIPKPFSTYEAAISSSIYLEYDSIKGRYVAYAGQNNIRSWAKRSKDEQNYGLRHEQYHFNITEVHARTLDKYIKENPQGTLESYLLQRDLINIGLRRMQNQYDDETNHSLLYGRQQYWEFKIDSMLNFNSGWTIDYMTGAKAFFSDTPRVTKGINSKGEAFRTYELHKYDIIFKLESYQIPEMSSDILERLLATSRKKNKEVVVANKETQGDVDKLHIVSIDSSGFTTHRYWMRKGNLLCHASAQPPNELRDSASFNTMAYSFLNSFSLEDVQLHWISREKASQRKFALIKTEQVKRISAIKKRNSYCVISGQSAKYGIFNGPMKTDDGSLFIVYDIFKDAVGSRANHILFIGDDMYSFERDSSEQFFYIPKERLPSGPFEAQIGYTLKSDSTRACFRFFQETIWIEDKWKDVQDD
jgi:hypothetical protein